MSHASTSDDDQLEIERTIFFQETLGDDEAGSLPAGLHANIWYRARKHSDWVTFWGEAEDSVSRNGRTDVYLGPALLNKQGGAHERVKNATAAGLLALGKDIDIRDAQAHKQENLPPDMAAALDYLTAIGLPPTFIVHSGHGIQCEWVFTTPWVFTDAADRTRAARLAKAWDAYLNQLAEQRGWTLDPTGDLARLLRVPGTYNAKVPDAVVPVRLLNHSPYPRYMPDDIVALLGGWEAIDAPLTSAGATAAGATASNTRAVADQRAAADGTTTDHREAIDASQRYTAQRPCPICGGHADLPAGTSKRCWGFRHEDGQVAFCTRENYARGLPVTTLAIGPAYAHQLGEDCACGVTHPRPDAPDAPPSHSAGGRFRYTLDDKGNGQRFADRFGTDYRYNHTTKQFHHWNGVYWPVAEKEQQQQDAKRIVADIRAEALEWPDGTPERKALLSWAKASGMGPHIREMLKMASSEPGIAKVAEDFDADDMLLAFPNGYLQLGTGAFDPPYRSALVTMVCAAPYLPDATSDDWEQTKRLFLPDEAQRQDFFTAVGYCLSGRGKEHSFIAYGEPKRGKSTVMGAIAEALGSYATTVDLMTFTTGARAHTSGGAREDLVALVGKRLVVASEATEHMRLNAAALKQMTGGTDRLSIRANYGKQFTTKPVFGLWILTNNLPKLPADDNGTWERLHVFGFTQYITPEHRDEAMRDRVVNPATTGSAILVDVVRGWLRYQRDLRGRLQLPTTVKSTSAYRKQQDHLARFLEEECVTGPLVWCYFTDFKLLFREWLKDNNIREEFSDNRIAKALNAYPAARHPVTQQRCRRGVSLRRGRQEYASCPWDAPGASDSENDDEGDEGDDDD